MCGWVVPQHSLSQRGSSTHGRANRNNKNKTTISISILGPRARAPGYILHRFVADVVGRYRVTDRGMPVAAPFTPGVAVDADDRHEVGGSRNIGRSVCRGRRVRATSEPLRGRGI